MVFHSSARPLLICVFLENAAGKAFVWTGVGPQGAWEGCLGVCGAQQALGRTTQRGRSNPACVTSLPHPVHAPAEGTPSCPPRRIASECPSVPTTPAPQSPWPPAQGSWAGPSVSTAGPCRAGGAACRGHEAQGRRGAADGVAAVHPVEASASGCWPGPRRVTRAGRAGVSPPQAGAQVGSLRAARALCFPPTTQVRACKRERKKPILGLHGCGSAIAKGVPPPALDLPYCR